jgi:nucleoside-diphosphate-sugar epimerase
MKALIIGNTGFIGSFLTQKLIDKGYEITGLDVNSNDNYRDSFRFVQGSILNPDDIMKAATGTDVIINLAAKHQDFGVSEKEFFEVNVQGTRNILDCASRLGIKKFIFYSSVAVYGNHEIGVTEETPLNPVNPYGRSKLEAEKLIHDWAAQEPTREVVIIRPAVVFGPQNYANMYKLIDSIYKKRFFFVGQGDNIKSVAYVENLVDATIFLLESLKPGIAIYNYSDYHQMTISETVRTIAQYLPSGIPKIKIPLGPAVVAAGVFDLLGKVTGHNFPITSFRIKKFNMPTHFESSKIRESGFRQRIDLSAGFRKTVEWYLGRRAPVESKGAEEQPNSRQSTDSSE